MKTPLCILTRDVIPSGVHPKELDISWLTKINVKQAYTKLKLLQRNTELERENKQLKKELLDQKLLLLEYKTYTDAKLEEARIREENLMRSNNEFREEMRNTNKLLHEMMELLQKQAKP